MDTHFLPSREPLDDYELITQPLEAQEVPQLSVEQQINNAHRVAGALRASIGYLSMQVRGQETKTGDIDAGNAMPDIAHAIIRGRHITVEPTGLILPSSVEREKPEPMLGPTDRMSAAMGRLLRLIAPRAHQVSYTVVAEDGYDGIKRATIGQRVDSRNFVYPQRVRRQHLLDLHDVLKREGVIGLADTAGRDYSYISTGALVGQTDKPGGIVDALRHSEWGEVQELKDGQAVFYPSRELESISIRDKDRQFTGLKYIPLIDKFGVEDHTTLYADVTRRTLRNTRGLHIVGPRPGVGEAAMLLRAVGSINQQRYHAIDANWHHMTPEQYALSIARELEYHTHEFITNRNRFASFDNFNAYEYAARHYSGEKAVSEDQDICRYVGFALSTLDMRVRRAADIGCGPNPYPGMLLLPFADTIDLLEYSQSNRDYMQAFFSGTLPHNHMEMWRKFPTYMTEGGGDKYVNTFDDIRRAADQRRVSIQQGDIFDLQADTWDLMSAYFVVDSISVYREDQHDAIASMAKALTEDGLLITANMLNNKDHIGYPAGDGQEYPNISQTVEEMREPYIDNDMFAIAVKVKHGKRAGRDGYDGMAIIFACHRDSDRKQQLLDLVPELEKLGAEVVL